MRPSSWKEARTLSSPYARARHCVVVVFVVFGSSLVVFFMEGSSRVLVVVLPHCLLRPASRAPSLVAAAAR
ncbi:sodium:solute symporter [Sesbania bispinosa]|nr:sodium:solute symporter [Sesbania bispinosa]